MRIIDCPLSPITPHTTGTATPPNFAYASAMCGRYNLHDMPAIDTLRQLIPGLDDVVPPSRRYNVAPGTDISAVFLPDPESDPQLDLFWWGFRPAWVDGGGPQPINAKVEGVATSKYWRGAFARHRCLVPANGWYEWLPTADGKQPHYITRGDGELLWFAALWTQREDDRLGCAIITEPARGSARDVHDRMPLCLTRESLPLWLDPDLTDRETLRSTVQHIESDALVHWPVSQRVGNVKNDDASLIVRIN